MGRWNYVCECLEPTRRGEEWQVRVVSSTKKSAQKTCAAIRNRAKRRGGKRRCRVVKEREE